MRPPMHLPMHPPMRPVDRLILQGFRAVALAEGVSFVALIAIAMPLKYLAAMPQAVHLAGWLHGGLFLAYLAALLPVLVRRLLPAQEAFNAFGLSLVPLGPFFGDRPLRARLMDARLADTRLTDTRQSA